MKQIGYYAMQGKNLFQFEWSTGGNIFYIINPITGKKEIKNPDDYEILEIGYFHDES